MAVSTALSFAVSFTAPQHAEAYSNKSDLKRRILYYFKECLSTDHLDWDGKERDGDNDNIEFSSTTEMFKSGERIAVGIDIDDGNGVMDCYTIAKRAGKYLWDLEGQDLETKLQKEIWGKTIASNNYKPLKVGNGSGQIKPDNVKKNASSLRNGLVQKEYNKAAEGYEKQYTLQRFMPLFNQCFKPISDKGGTNSYPEGSIIIKDRKIFASSRSFGWKNISKPKITGNDGVNSNTGAEIGDIELDFFPGGVAEDFIKFDDRSSHWYPIGNDLPISDRIKKFETQAVANCNVFKENKDYFFGKKGDKSSHFIIRDAKLAIFTDKNGNDKVDKGEIEKTDDPINTSNDSELKATQQCIVNPPLSWILCPLITVSVEAIEKLDKWIINALDIPPLTTDGAFQDLYTTWTSFRNLANSFLVLIFLIAIFAQVLPLELDPYMIKKILPRLIAAAILIQMSYFLIQIMFDISRILGMGVGSIINSVNVTNAGGGVFGTNLFGSGSQDATATSTFAFLLAGAGTATGITVVAGIGWAIITPLLLLLLSALISILTLFLTLQIRMVVIIIFTIISPLAFLAWVLPNTEDYFKKWITSLIKLLLMYPIIVFMVSSSALITQVSGNAVKAVSGDEGVTLFLQILVSATPIIIFFMIPMTFKWAGGVFGTIAGAVQNQGGKLSKRARSGALMKNSLAGIKEKGEDNLLRSKAFKLSSLRNNPDASVRQALGSGFSRLGARTLSGNAFSFGKVGERKIAETVKKARARKLELQSAVVEKLEAPNPVIGEMIAARLNGEEEYTYTDKRGNKRTVKLTDDIVAGGMKYLNDHGGHVEISKIGNGTMEFETGEYTKDRAGNTVAVKNRGPAIYDPAANNGRGGYNVKIKGFEDIAQIMAETTENNTAALLKAAPHMVHAKGSALYKEATADVFSGMKGAGMEVAKEVIQGDKDGEANLADVIVDIMNSSDKAGKIDPGVAKIMKDMVLDPDNPGLGSQMIDLGNGPQQLRSIINEVFTTNGKIKYNDSAKRG